MNDYGIQFKGLTAEGNTAVSVAIASMKEKAQHGDRWLVMVRNDHVAIGCFLKDDPTNTPSAKFWITQPWGSATLEFRLTASGTSIAQLAGIQRFLTASAELIADLGSLTGEVK